MRTIIAGSRSIAEYATVALAIEASEWAEEITEVVSGGAHGVDSAGEQWAAWNDKRIKVFTPQWKTYGKAAGPMRNEDMARYANAAIIVWDGESRGSMDMLERAETHELCCFVCTVVTESETR